MYNNVSHSSFRAVLENTQGNCNLYVEIRSYVCEDTKRTENEKQSGTHSYCKHEVGYLKMVLKRR